MPGFDERKQGSHQKVVALVGKNRQVLEIGSGPGFVSERLKQNGCTVTAIELDPQKARKARRFCKKVLVGNVEEMRLPFSKKSFDAVLFGDVLEHLHSPESALQRVKPSLRDNGLIVVSLPNVANWKIRLKLLFGKFEYTDWGILDKTHLRFFTRKTAAKLIEGAGYEIVKQEFVPSFPLPFLKALLAKAIPGLFAFEFVFAAKKRRV